MILSNRSLVRSGISMFREKNAAFKWGMSGTIIVMSLILSVPFLKNLFQFGAVSSNDVLLALAGGVVAVVLMELLKIIPMPDRFKLVSVNAYHYCTGQYRFSRYCEGITSRNPGCSSRLPLSQVKWIDTAQRVNPAIL